MPSVKRPRQIRFDVAKQDILGLFTDSPGRVFSHLELKGILDENREYWRLTKSTTITDFIEYLSEKGQLQRIEIIFPKSKMVRYTWGRAPTYAVILSWHPQSYLSHYTAVYLHDLTEPIPKTIYLNVEQPRIGSFSGSLTQGGMDAAFKRPMRRSKTVA